MTTGEVITKVKAVMDSRGIPEYVWLPIAYTESSFNPNAHALTSREDSRGLFQINLTAHPQFESYNLYDPTVNATLAADDFINPAYTWAIQQGFTDHLSIAEITYSGLKNPNSSKSSYVPSGGIRPAWTAATKARFETNFNKFQNGYDGTGGDTTPRIGNYYTMDGPIPNNVNRGSVDANGNTTASTGTTTGTTATNTGILSSVKNWYDGLFDKTVSIPLVSLLLEILTLVIMIWAIFKLIDGTAPKAPDININGVKTSSIGAGAGAAAGSAASSASSASLGAGEALAIV